MASKLLPAVQVYARPVGYIQWVCPNCREIFGAKTIPWRRARISCTACGRAYRIGLDFTKTFTTYPPMSAKKMHNWNGYTANRIDAIGMPAIARIRARLDWVCPDCSVAQFGPILPHSAVECVVCRAYFFISVLFYPSTPGAPIKCPLDWTIPYESVKDPIDSVALAKIS